MANIWKTVRVFISSTFRDMHAERDHLVTVVFPELRERLELLGFELYDVDLRWGVPQMGVDGEKANSWAYCKQWIDRVEPFFICILGQRYGWKPPAEEIQDPGDRAAYQGMSITEMEIHHAVLTENLNRRSFFYLRGVRVPETAPKELLDQFVDADEEQRIETLKSDISDSNRPVRKYPCSWTGSGFEDLDEFGNLILEDLWSGVLRDERYVPRDIWKEVLGHEPDEDVLYTDESRPIPEDIWKRIVERAKPKPLDPLDAEAEEMAAFAESRLRWFQGRQRELTQLIEFVDTDLPAEVSRLCVVRAVAGQGKSALLARLADGLTGSPHLVLTHFVGATESSADVRSMLERFVKELDRNGIPHPQEDEPKEDLDSLKKRLAARLEGSADGRRVVLIIDAVNQLTSAPGLGWLPSQLGINVRVILSCIDDPSSPAQDAAAQAMSALRLRQPEPRWVDLAPLEEKDVREIVVNYLHEYCKELDADQIDSICRMQQAKNPLYLLVMLHELRKLGGQDMHLKVGEIIGGLPVKRPGAVSLFDWALERLEVFGEEPVRLWCTYLALGRVGMSSRELSDLLKARLGEDAGRTALLIERGIRVYLQKRGQQWDFFHGQLREAVTQRYLPEDASPFHSHIASYLNTRWRELDRHALSELPWHLVSGGLQEETRNVLTDFPFLQAKLDVLGTQALVADYDLLHVERNDPLGLIQGALYLSAPVLARDTAQLASQLSGRLPHFRRPLIHKLLGSIQRHAATRLRPLMPSLTCAGGPLVKTLSQDFEKLDSFAMVCATAVNNDGTRAVSAGFGQRLYVWNMIEGRVIRVFTADVVLLDHTKELAMTGEGSLVVLPTLDGSLIMFDTATGVSTRTQDSHVSQVRAVAVCGDGSAAISGGDDVMLKVWDLATGRCTRTLAGHTGVISTVSITKDGVLAASGSVDRTVRVWDLTTGECTLILRGHEQAVSGVAITDDGSHLVSASTDATLRIWDLATGAFEYLLRGHKSKVNTVAVTPDGCYAVSASDDKTLKVWRLDRGECVLTLAGHSDCVNSVSISNDGATAVSGSTDATLKMWDMGAVRNHDLMASSGSRTVGEHPEACKVVAVSPDGKLAASGSADMTVKVWDLTDGTCRLTFEGHEGWLTAIGFTSNGRQLCSGAGDGVLRMWDLTTGKCSRLMSSLGSPIRAAAVTTDGRNAITAVGSILCIWNLDEEVPTETLEGHTAPINTVTVMPNGKQAVSGDEKGVLKVWDLAAKECTLTIESHMDRVNTVAVTPDSLHAISGSDDCELRIWNLETSELEATLKGHQKKVTSIAITSDGARAISASADKTIKVWDLARRKCQQTLEGHDDWVTAVTTTPDSPQVVSASDDGTIKLWDIDAQAWARTLEGHDEQIRTVAVADNASRAVSASADGTLRVWNVNSGICEQVLTGHKDWVVAAAVTPDGSQAVSASDDKTVRLWTLDGGFCLKTFTGHRRPVGAAAIARDGRKAVSGGDDKTLRIWDLNTGECTLVLQGHGDWVRGVMFTRDGDHIVSASDDHTLKLWNVETGTCLRTFTGHNDQVRSLALTVDGLHLISASSDKTLKLWNLATGECLQTFAGHTDVVSSIALARDSSWMVSASADKMLRRWNLLTGKCLAMFEGHTDHVSAVAMINNDSRIVSASTDRTVRAWDVLTAREIASFIADGKVVSCRAAGNTIVAGDSVGHVHILQLTEVNDSEAGLTEYHEPHG